MPYNIHAECEIGPIVSRRVLANRAIKQARDYRRLGYANVRIVDLETGEVFDAQSLAANVAGGRGGEANSSEITPGGLPVPPRPA